MDSGVRELSDPALERELAVVSALRHAGATAGPRSDERDRMRATILAGLQEHVREQEVDPAPPRVALLDTARRTRETRRSGARSRVTVASAAALCLLMTLSGMSLLLSRDAVPGDALYAMKRTAEAAELGLTFGDDSKAEKHLEFAAARVDEIEVLAAEAGPNGTGGSGRIIDALDDFDKDTAAGSRLITGQAADGDDDQLGSLDGWAEQQQLRLDELSTSLPLAVSARLASSLNLLERVQDRAAALEARSDCESIASGAKDEIGPLPARAECDTDDGRTPAVRPTDEAQLVPSTQGTPPGTTAPVLPGTPEPTTADSPPGSIVTDALPLPLPSLQGPSAPPPIVVDLPLLDLPLEVPPILPKTPGLQIN